MALKKLAGGIPVGSSINQTFTTDGSYTIPSDTHVIRVILKGGEGQDMYYNGGNGGTVDGYLFVEPGDTVNVEFAGGGKGGDYAAISFNPEAFRNLIGIAGGGGEGSSAHDDTTYEPAGPGGNGGGNIGAGGGGKGGSGGTQTSGGSPGTGEGNGSPGSFMQGGNGAGGNTNGSYWGYGGDGGAGFYGGGGGGKDGYGTSPYRGGGGGGGSSYVGGLFQVLENSQGTNAGPPEVQILGGPDYVPQLE